MMDTIPPSAMALPMSAGLGLSIPQRKLEKLSQWQIKKHPVRQGVEHEIQKIGYGHVS